MALPPHGGWGLAEGRRCRRTGLGYLKEPPSTNTHTHTHTNRTHTHTLTHTHTHTPPIELDLVILRNHPPPTHTHTIELGTSSPSRHVILTKIYMLS